jgi:class 3 adenylate cyclase
LRALEQMVARAGGTVARVDGLASTTVFDTPRASERSPFHPLQSPWWILPFALCLSGEWWLRRRDGLR